VRFRLGEDCVDQLCVLREPVAIFFRSRAFSIAPAVGQFDAEKLAEQLGALRLRSLPQHLLDARPLARQPGVLEAVAKSVHPRVH
jgi:hypothetical protein